MAASGPIASRMGAPGVEEVGLGAWWCLAWVDIPYPSGRSPWTSGTVRGQKQGGGCCRPSVLPPSGRTRPQKVQTASRSTSPKPRLDSERKTEVSPTHLLTYPHPCEADLRTNLSLSLSPILDFLPAIGCLTATLPSAFPSLHVPQLQIHFSCSLNKQ